MTSLAIFTASLQKSLARIWLNLKSEKYDRREWFNFVAKVLGSNRNAGNKPLLFVGLATSFLASEARSQSEFLVAYDIFKIALVRIWAAIDKLCEEKMVIFDQLHEEYCLLIEDFIETHKDDLTRKEGLYHDDNGAVESILYPIRTFCVLGSLSYLAYFWGKKGKSEEENQLVKLIETIICKNPSALTPPLDSLRKDIAITLTELCKTQRKKFAEEWMEKLLENLYQRYIRSGWWPSVSDEPQEVIENTFHFSSDKGKPESYLVPILFRFCAKLGAKKIYDRYRVILEDFRFLEFFPPEDIAIAESEFIEGNLEHGTLIERKFPQKFDDYCVKVCNIPLNKFSPIVQNRPYILQMITDVHLHYVFPEIYLDF